MNKELRGRMLQMICGQPGTAIILIILQLTNSLNNIRSSYHTVRTITKLRDTIYNHFT